MDRVVLLRAKLVCEYAQSLRPDLSYQHETRAITNSNFNGMVLVVGKFRKSI
jgi:hypothetical protein